jgi:uncharacterized protein involved in outer membrane biogenesis
MKRLVRIILIAVAALVILVVGSIAALLALLDDDDYRRLASYLVERETGRTLIVDGRFALYPSLRPSLVMSKVRIPNPPWAAGPDLAQIDHLEVQIALTPLLSGTLAVERLIINDARFALERSADGRANWTIGDDDPGLDLVPVFGTVRLRDIDWSYRDDAGGRSTSVTLAHLTLEETGAAAQLDAKGEWDGEPIRAQGTLGTLAEALRPSRPFPIDLSATVSGLDLSANGTIAEPAAGRGLDLHLVAKSDDVGPLLQRLGGRAPLAGPLDGEATLGGDFDAVQVADLHLSVGDSSSPEKAAAVQANGSIGTVSPGGAMLLDGIALEVQGAISTADLSDWLGRPLPDLGPVQGQVMLRGTSEALSATEMKLAAGAEDRLTLGATGAIGDIRLAPAFSVAGVDLQLAAEGHDLAALGTMIGRSLPPGAFSYHGRLSGDPGRWTLAGKARLGDTALTQTFTGSVAATPPRLSGELSLAIAGLELTGTGTVADPASGQGLDLHLVGHADDVAPLLARLGYRVPSGRLAAEATIGGDLEALSVSDLQLSVHQGTTKSSPSLQATGQIASVTPNGAPLFQGIALDVQAATSSASLSGWLGRPLPDLGPLGGRFSLSGTSTALKVSALKLQAGAAGRLSIGATGGVREIRLTPALAFRGANLQLDARAPDPGVIGALLDVSVPTIGAISYTGQLSGDLDMWKLSGKAQVGRTVIEESLTGSRHGARPRIAGELSVPALHLADFGVGSAGTSDADRPPTPETIMTSFVSSVAPLRALDLALNVEIGQVEGTKLSIGRGKADLTLEDGVLRLDPAQFDFVAGTALLHATADTRSRPPKIDLSLQADDVRLGEFLLAIGKIPPITGELALILKLQGAGDSPKPLVASLNGEGHFAIQRGGVALGSLNLATADVMTWLLAGAQRGTGLLRGITASGRTSLDCFAGGFVVADGIATAQSLLMKTPLTISTAAGNVNLVDQTIDLEVHLRARRGSTFDPATNYRIQGPLTDPAVNFSKTGFVARTLLNLALKPLDALGSLLRPLVEDGGKDRTNPCLQ